MLSVLLNYSENGGDHMTKNLSYAMNRLQWWLQYRVDYSLTTDDRARARQRIRVWIAEVRRLKV